MRKTISVVLTGIAVVALEARADDWTEISPGEAVVECVAADPVSPEVVYSGNRGVWRSTDGGASWSLAKAGLSARVLLIERRRPVRGSGKEPK